MSGREQVKTGSDLESIQPAVSCHCTNVCNRAVGRGSCPCLRSNRLCSQFCKCGSTRMGCKNRQYDEEVESPMEVAVTRLWDQTKHEALIHKKVHPGRGRRGRKRKADVTQQNVGGARRNISEFWPWLSVSKSGENAYCCLCKCDVRIDRGQESLLKHGQSKKHAENVEHSPQKETMKEENRGRYLHCVLENLPQFKPWLRVNKITGGAYCLFCRFEIGGKSLEELDSHKASQRHLIFSEMTKAERKEAQGTMKPFSKEDLLAGQKSGTLPPHRKSPSSQLPQEMDHREEREEGSTGHIDGDKVWSPDLIKKHVKEAKAQVASFMVENSVPLEVTDNLVRMLKCLPAAGVVMDRLDLGEEFTLNLIRQTTDSLLNVFLVESLKTNLFSLMVDCQTTQAGVTYLGIFALYCNKKLEIQLVLFDMLELRVKSADAIFNTLQDSLQKKEGEGILLGNWIGFLCNTTNISSCIMAQLMDMVKQQYSWVMPVVAPGHIADLAAVEATRHLPSHIQEACQLIHSHFCSGTVNAASYVKYNRFVTARAHRILADQNLPWTACCGYLSDLLEQWKMLAIYFANSDAVKPGSEFRPVLEFLKNPLMKLHVVVLHSISMLISDYHNKILKEEPLFHNINDHINELVRTFANFFMIREQVMGLDDLSKLDVNDEESYLPLPQIYLGFQGSSTLAVIMEKGQLTFEDANICKFLLTIREFYKEFIQQLQISHQFCRPLWMLSEVINPQTFVNAQKTACTAGDVFDPFVASDLVNVKQLETELREIEGSMLPESEESRKPLHWWSHFLNSSTESYQNVKRVISFFFSLPISNSSCRQIFNYLKEWNVDAGLKLQTTSTGDFLKENVFIKELYEGHRLEQCRKEAKR